MSRRKTLSIIKLDISQVSLSREARKIFLNYNYKDKIKHYGKLKKHKLQFHRGTTKSMRN